VVFFFSSMPEGALDRLRALSLALPEAWEKISHGEPTWFAGGRKVFVTYADHHHDGNECRGGRTEELYGAEVADLEHTRELGCGG